PLPPQPSPTRRSSVPAAANPSVRALHAGLSQAPSQPGTRREFHGSMTTLRPELLGDTETRRVLVALDLDARSLTDDDDADRLVRSEEHTSALQSREKH